MVEKNEVLKIAGLARGFVSTEELSNTMTLLIYEVLNERKALQRPLSWHQEFSDSLKRFSSKGTDQIKKELEKYSNEDLVDIAFYFVSNPLGSRFVESSNYSLNRLVLSLLKIRSGDLVFDLGSGNGSFLVNLQRYCNEHKIELKDMFGLEINKQAVEVSRANLLIAGAKSINIDLRDFIDGVPPMYNKGFVFPPLGDRVLDHEKIKSQNFDYTFNRRNSFEWVFVDRLLKGLIGRDRRAVAIMSPRSMFNDADKGYRDHLIDAGLIEMIVELPAGSLNFTSIKPVLVVFSDGNEGAKVVDATSLEDKAIGKFAKYELEYNKVLELISGADIISNDELKKSHSLSASTLLAAKEQVLTGTPLCELAEVFTGSQYTLRNFEQMFKNEPTGYKVLTPGDVQDGFIEWDKLQSIEYKDKKFDKYAVIKGDVIITAKTSKVKIAVVDIDPEEKILVTGGMIIVRPNTKKLNPTYLKIFLDSAKGQAALKSIQRGSIIISINAKDLASVLIPDIDIKNQDSISLKYNDMLYSYINLKKELARLEDQIHSFDMCEAKEG